MDALRALGWDEAFERAFHESRGEGETPARVIAEHRGAYEVAGEGTPRMVRMARALERSGERPAVGDWVRVRQEEEHERISGILPRRTKLARKAAGESSAEQLVCANVDWVLLVSPLDRLPHRRAFERFLLVAHESGARPVVVLTKADLHPDPSAVASELAPALATTPLHVVSVLSAQGTAALELYLGAGQSLVLLGSSGAGKSTLINAWLSAQVQRTQEVLKDKKGRHTTTHRQLFRLPGGALVIDTPGVRELGLLTGEVGLKETFPEIDELARGCRFGDCAHDTEPGCAVRAALADGTVSGGRFESYQKLKRELAHAAAQTDAALRLERKREEKRLHRAYHDRPKRR